jgi:aldehyde:ferredoxin oxidoreductase
MMIESKKQTAQNDRQVYGFTGRILRVDLSAGKSAVTSFDKDTLRKYVGGAALGIKTLYDEVPPGTEWSDPENRLFLFSGPLGGTRVGGSGAIAVVTVGALTNGIASTQANGFFGAFLRFSGFDGVILQGAAPDWVYLHIHDGIAEIKDARHLLGRDTFEVDRIIKEELGKKERETSIMAIGAAGENLVRFACISADHGHVAAHNGVGAVMGSKKLKAIAVDRGRHTVPLYDKEALSRLAEEILANMLNDMFYNSISKEGTLSGVIQATKAGFIPTRNYTTAVHNISDDKLEAYSPQNIRRVFNARPSPCWACSSQHCHMGKIAEGKYAGRVVEEPEYEGLAAFSSLVGIDDATTSIVLANEVDRLGIDTNEAGWVISWVMECYEKGILSKKDIDGLEMTWGNSDSIMALLENIALRRGFGDVLAEGVMRAARHIGGEAPDMAIYTLKGNTPRSHDHRAMWLELFDTCVSNTGTLETHSKAPLKLLGLPETFDSFDPEMISTIEAKIKGAMLFDDSLVACRFQTATALDLLCRAINAATGWNMDFQEAMMVGKRAANLARAFNLRQGIGAELDAPSARYGSTPHDGVATGRSISACWDKMLRNYYQIMGWDVKTGKPLPETLTGLGLDFVIPRLWP